MIQRRGFLAGMLGLGVAPAIVTSKGFLPTFEPRVWVPDHDVNAMSLNLHGGVLSLNGVPMARVTNFQIQKTFVESTPNTFGYSSAKAAMENHWRMLREQREAMNRFGDVDKMIKGIVQDILRK